MPNVGERSRFAGTRRSLASFAWRHSSSPPSLRCLAFRISSLFPFLAWRPALTREALRADVLAGFISALLVLPQGVAYATLAGMPPQYGLYAAMLPAVVGALWGSSWHLVSGPTNATSLMVFASLSAIAVPFSDGYVQLALTLNLMIGVIKLGLGAARLGGLANFISPTVVVGFTAGAGLLIIAAQLRPALGLTIPASPSFVAAIEGVVRHLSETDPWTLLVSLITLAAAMVGRRLAPRLPHLLVGLFAGGIAAWWLARQGIAHVPTVGALPSALPAPSLPDLHPGTWRTLAPAAFALTLIGLTEAISSARAVALRSGQRLDPNQECIGQGLGNVVGAFTSSYPSSGSFNRTGANYQAGARTPLAAIFSAGFLLLVLMLVAPLAAYLPLAGMAGLLFLVAAGLIDVGTVRRITRASRSEVLVLVVTFAATLLLPLEFAIFVGVLASLFTYLYRTTRPRLTPIDPDAAVAGRLVPLDARTAAGGPELVALRVDGSFFFGAVDHVADTLQTVRAAEPPPRCVLLVGSGMNFIDVAGAELLVQEARAMARTGIVLALAELKPPVYALLARGGYLEALGEAHIFATAGEAIAALRPASTPAPDGPTAGADAPPQEPGEL